MKNKVYKISLFSMMFVCAMNGVAHARVNVRNYSSYNTPRNHAIAAQQQAIAANTNIYVTTASATETLPVAVDNAELANNILNNTSDTINAADLENCSMIYPTGIFKWATPESGIRRNPFDQCVAIVELRDANTNAVLAQTTLASGDMMKCNIDMFPQSGWQSALSNVELPADAAPTIDDVQKVMNKEQKQNAGVKIAAGAILAGLAGNMLAPKEAGDTKLLGTSKTQLVDTAIAATAGAGIMAASTYSGKVAGDTIKSTAVNAAAGAVVGNMAGGMSGGGESTLTIKECTIKDDNNNTIGTYGCIAGKFAADTQLLLKDNNGDKLYLADKNSKVYECDKCTNNGMCCNDEQSCVQLDYNGQNYKNCKLKAGTYFDITLTNNNKLNEVISNTKSVNGAAAFKKSSEKEKDEYEPATITDAKYITNDTFFVVKSAQYAGDTTPAYAIFADSSNQLKKKVLGYKASDWDSDIIIPKQGVVYYRRARDGSVGAVLYPTTKANENSEQNNTNTNSQTFKFIPSGVDADDGALVDFSNAGRAKATITGAGVGGALGGFTGYQGAKQEVQERYLSAVREYDDSLTNFYCATGTRFLSKYNDYIEIPLAQKFE